MQEALRFLRDAATGAGLYSLTSFNRKPEASARSGGLPGIESFPRHRLRLRVKRHTFMLERDG